MKKFILVFVLIIFCTTNAQTWNSNVGAIIYKKCSNCHYPGGIGPFSLRSYQDAVANKASIKDAVTNKRMPPWPADPSYQRYAHENFLYQSEIQAISSWVNNNTPEGTGIAPMLPVLPSGTQLGTPDQSIIIPTFTSTATNTDVYQTFPFRSGLTVDKYLNGLEIIPGNNAIVHHVIIYKDMSNWAFTRDSALNSPEPGFKSSGGGPASQTSNMIGAWAPGVQAVQYPTNMGIKLEANTNYMIEIHYPKGSVGQQDSTRINFHYLDNPSQARELLVGFIVTHTAQDVAPFYIPANTVKTFHTKVPLSFGVDFSLLSVFPHMHLIGQQFDIFATKNDTDTIPLIKINKWDFNWQFNYFFRRPIRIKNGSEIEGIASYDNTSNNINNPSNPPQIVLAGEETTNEMMIGGFTFMIYNQGDEDILIATDTMASDTLQTVNINNFETKNNFSLFPNPTQDVLNIYFKSFYKGKIQVYDVSGKLLIEKIIASTSETIDVTTLSKGIYYFKTISEEGIFNSKKFIIN